MLASILQNINTALQPIKFWEPRPGCSQGAKWKAEYFQSYDLLNTN